MSEALTDQKLRILDYGIMEPYIEMLNTKDPVLLKVLLEGISFMLDAGVREDTMDNEVAIRFEENGGLSRLESLQYHSNRNVYEKSVLIIDKFYGLEEVGQACEQNFIVTNTSNTEPFNF